MKALVFVFFTLAGFLQAETDTELLRKVDKLASYTDSDFYAEYTIVQSKPGQAASTTVALVSRRDAKNQYVIIIKKPDISRGQGYLKQGDTIWFYDPQSRKSNRTSSKDRFRNSNASNSDFTRSTLAEDYDVKSGAKETLGRFTCRVLDLKAKPESDVTYPVMKIWVDETGLVRKTEDYSLSGQLLRTTGIPEYYKIGSRYVPRKILIVDELRGANINNKFEHEKTIITLDGPQFGKIADSTFTLQFLESAGIGG